MDDKPWLTLEQIYMTQVQPTSSTSELSKDARNPLKRLSSKDSYIRDDRIANHTCQTSRSNSQASWEASLVPKVGQKKAWFVKRVEILSKKDEFVYSKLNGA